ncbi:MAG: UDP-2,3-diacylglucosamine diphosphatase [Burkholderiales bacterium]|jgi:UDP-2,3-diacylglucosamine hydrolase|nr:UDP-2,3-diacylglucosamine diphosphatase [Burkholderiales bacterium]
MHTLLISDLHLAPERPAITAQFLRFARDTAAQAQALYVLGDLFEYWAGDDDDDALGIQAAAALQALSAGGTRVFLMHGNRDVLMGQALAKRCGATLLADPLLTELHGAPTLLTHGDALCTDDADYQRFRAYARDPANQAKFLAQPLAERREQMRGMRAQSEASKQRKAEAIMDVAPAAVEALLRRHGYPRLIHGHTHRPARHVHEVDGHRCERWVLNDWYERGGYLRCDSAGCTMHRL